MTLKLIDISVAERGRHRLFADRVVGTVRAVLRETGEGYDQEHVLTLRVWTQVRIGLEEQEIDVALMMKAGEIIGRVKSRIEDQPEAAE